MRLMSRLAIPSLAALVVMTTAGLAQPGPDMSQQDPNQGPPGGGYQQMPPQGGYQQPQGGPMLGQGGHRAPMFDMANVTHDGRLTRDQAQSGGMRHIVQHFDEIDADHKGYVTKQDIKSWRMARRQAKAAQMQQPAPQQQ